MTYLLAVLAGIAGAALGYGAGIAVGLVLVEIFQISSREGGSGLFVAFVTGPIGALIGLVVAVVLVFKFRGSLGAAAIGGRSLLVVFGILVSVPLMVWLYTVVFPSEYLQANGPAPLLEMEVRLPAGAFVPADPNLIRLQLSEKNTRDADFDSQAWRREEEGRVILAASTLMFFRSSSRLAVLQMPLQPDRIWRLPLRTDPRGATEWSPWRPVDEVFDAGATTARTAKPEEAAEIRVRVFPR